MLEKIKAKKEEFLNWCLENPKKAMVCSTVVGFIFGAFFTWKNW